MSRRSGFTLIELLISIVLTAVVSLLVYGAAQVGRDTQERIADERHSLLSALAMRILIESALRAAQATFLAPDTMFVLENRTIGRGVPGDRLTFVAPGDIPPLSPGADWTLTLHPTPQGLRLMGSPRGVRIGNRLIALLPGVTGLAVRVMHPDIAGGWSQEWSLPSTLPEAVELTYWSDSGPVGVPLTVSPALGQVP